MRKLLLSAILLSGALACHAQEQANIVATFYYDEGIPGIVWGISDNGQWAVGYDDMVAYNAFYWNREEQKFVDVFGLDENGEMAEGYAAALYDVSDNGLAVGKFEDGRTGYTYPGIFDCTQNTWTALPTLVEINNAAYAQAITPDGGLIAGSASAEIVTSDALPGSTIKTGGPKVPVIWRNNQIERYDEAEYVGQGAWINDMNADGSMLCGYAEWDDGSRSPAVWKDGVMVRLVGTEPAISNPDKWQEFYEGQMYCFNADATMAGGYFSEGMYGSTYGIVWDSDGTHYEPIRDAHMQATVGGTTWHTLARSKIRNPSNVLLLGDAYTMDRRTPVAYLFAFGESKMSYLHSKRMNAAMFDGHVESLSYDERGEFGVTQDDGYRP